MSSSGRTLTRHAAGGTDPISRIDRLADPDAPLTPDDIAVFRAALRRVAAGDDWEAAFDLAPGWLRHLHLRRATAAIASVTREGSERAQVERIRRAAQRYKASPRYAADLSRGSPADPDDAVSFALLQANGGCVASRSTILRLKAAGWFKTAGELDHANGDDEE
jgi:hypothetical protein